MSDFITTFMEVTESTSSPDLFRKWAAISAVGAACQRRVWIMTGGRKTYPNTYIWLVAPPGVGKQVINDLRNLVKALPAKTMFVAPKNMTKASMVDEFAASLCAAISPTGVPMEHHSLYCISEEIGVMMPSYDPEYLGLLNEIFDNPQEYEETRRHGPAKHTLVKMPQLSMLAGVQPGWMAATLPELAWQSGLMARTIMVYVPDLEIVDVFAQPTDMTQLNQDLIRDLGLIARKWAEFTWEPSALTKIREWHLAGGPPKPTHGKLTFYGNRRTQQIIKLSLISAVSRKQKNTIEEIDLSRAMIWLFEAEKQMPDVFRAMTGRSDQAVIEELHIYVTKLWQMNGQKPIHSNSIYAFLSKYLPSEKVGKLLEVAERSNVLARVAGSADLYLPRAKHMHGVNG